MPLYGVLPAQVQPGLGLSELREMRIAFPLPWPNFFAAAEGFPRLCKGIAKCGSWLAALTVRRRVALCRRRNRQSNRPA